MVYKPQCALFYTRAKKIMTDLRQKWKLTKSHFQRTFQDTFLQVPHKDRSHNIVSTMFNKTISGRLNVIHVNRKIWLTQHLIRVTWPEEPIWCVFYSQKMFSCAHRGSRCSISALWPQEGRHILFYFSTCARVTAFVLGCNWLLQASYFCRKQPCSFRINTLFIPPFCYTHTHRNRSSSNMTFSAVKFVCFHASARSSLQATHVWAHSGFYSSAFISITLI